MKIGGAADQEPEAEQQGSVHVKLEPVTLSVLQRVD
jgi:hypothetical protein